MHAPSFLCGGVEERRDGKPVPYGGRTRDDVGIVPYGKTATLWTFSATLWTKNIFIGKKLDFSPIEMDCQPCYNLTIEKRL